MAGPASDYHRGDMEIAEQKSTFHLVMGLTKWGSLWTAALLLYLTLQFCTDTGFLGSVVSAAVLIVLGTLLLREKPKGH